ncbi:phage head-tail joining protein [Agrobacterium vitis]|uniref:phage head-tail joining protein n=1 Tax=Agrobacterium vitis TaxID=373 RepID=UPI001573E04E|nr:hypothetical protein [Agrobacterium vitis]NSZ17558.1 hypothetical protein [Agrobacterium vitis]QZO03252.1 hypothetical protein K4831_12490 [Agrobacterium vitis]UJL88372.1 hypothetical protein AVF2S5_10830 [Agrobacterium vitis]
MASLIELQAYKGRLERAVFSGTRRLKDANGEEIEFRSQTELKSALASLERAIATAQGSPASTIRFQTSKGL